ncbi:MAG: C1 family peptidase [Polyangiaceae bacterium]
MTRRLRLRAEQNLLIRHSVRGASGLMTGACLSLVLVSACTIQSGRSSRQSPQPPPGQYAVPAQAPPPAAPPPIRAQAPAAPLGFTLPIPANIADLPLPPGWTMVNGIPMPVVPGLTPGQPAQPGQPSSTQALSSCGSVNVSGSPILLDCVSPQYGFVPTASKPLVNRKRFDAGANYVGAEPLPTSVDHRSAGKEGPVRDQGPVGACTAFSLAASVDHAIAQSGGTPGNVSVMQIWGRYHYPSMQSAADANRNQPLSIESNWRYSAKTACSWYTGGYCDCGSITGTSCNQPVDSAKLSSMDKAANVKVTNITEINVMDPAELKGALAKGQNIWFAMYVDSRFQDVRGKNAVIPDGDFRASRSGHAMVIAGYKTQGNGTYYLLHNSWGTSWGDGGYAWILEKTLLTNMKYGYLVDVSTSNPSTPDKPNQPGEPTPPAQNPGQCPAGTVPDSGIPLCLPPCADGSPRHFNTCPSPQANTGCGPGEVNIFGFCVTSPVAGVGSDSATGVHYTCGAGGCTYAVPYGVGGCRSALCTRSCPSPKYVLTAGTVGLGCSE